MNLLKTLLLWSLVMLLICYHVWLLHRRCSWWTFAVSGCPRHSTIRNTDGAAEVMFTAHWRILKKKTMCQRVFLVGQAYMLSWIFFSPDKIVLKLVSVFKCLHNPECWEKTLCLKILDSAVDAQVFVTTSRIDSDCWCLVSSLRCFVQLVKKDSHQAILLKRTHGRGEIKRHQRIWEAQ